MSNKSIRNKIFFIIIGAFLFLHIFSVMFSLFWGLINTFKEYEEFMVKPLAIPSKISFDNWKNTFLQFYIEYGADNQRIYIERMFINSILYAVGCSFTQTAVQCVVAYLASKYKFRFSKILYGVVIVTMILPIVGSLPSEIQMLRNLHLYNTYAGMIIMKMNFLGMYFLIFFSSFKSISWEYAEAAFIDGASHFSVMITIMFPLIKTTFFAIFILNFITYWNDYQTPMIYLESMPTAAYGLYYMKFKSGGIFGRTPMQLTGCIMLSIPCILLFTIFQKRLMGNLTLGGVKG